MGDTTSTTGLCPTAKLLVQVLDGASERAILLNSTGHVLYHNEAAEHFLYMVPPEEEMSLQKGHVTDFCVSISEIEGDWHTVRQSFIKMKNGKTTRSQRYIKIQSLEPCVCCSSKYYTMFVCSKHERVRQVVDSSFDPVLTMDTEGKICTANDAATELFGYTETEFVGLDISVICGGGHAENHSKYLSNYLKSGKAKVLGKKRQVLGKKRDGTEFPCEIGVQEITDVSSGNRYFCGFIKDLTVLLQHEQEIQERQARLQTMINASFDPMLEIDEVGIIQVVNDAACNMFGYTQEEFIGSNISMICGDGHASNHSQYLERYIRTGERHIIGRKRQVKARRKDGSEVGVELGVQEVKLQNGKLAFCGYIRDLTQQLKDKRALRKQQQLVHGKFFGGGGGDTTEDKNGADGE